jgi:hypothetical protein
MLSEKEKKIMNIANCPLNWALDFLDIEKILKVIEVPINIGIELTTIEISLCKEILK